MDGQSFKPIGREFWNIKPLWELKPPKPKHPIICPICNNNIFYFKHVPFFGVHIDRKEFEELRSIFIANKIDNLMLEYKHVGHWIISPKYEKTQ